MIYRAIISLPSLPGYTSLTFRGKIHLIVDLSMPSAGTSPYGAVNVGYFFQPSVLYVFDSKPWASHGLRVCMHALLLSPARDSSHFLP
jgi:hypothetical protein